MSFFAPSIINVGLSFMRAEHLVTLFLCGSLGHPEKCKAL